MTRVRRAAAVVLTLAAAVLATTAQGEARAATDSGSNGSTGHPMTRLRLHITGCDLCSVRLQNAVTGRLTVWTSKPQRIGGDQRAVFDVRTSRTAGMSFVLHAPWEGGTGAVPNIVTRYRGQKVDNRTTVAEARRGTHAEGCWAGSTVDDVRLDFHVARVRGRTLTGHPTYLPLAYATHAMSSWKPMVKTYRGTIANQDAFYCTQPKTTKVTFSVPGCAGCQIGVMNGARRIENTWAVAPKTMTGDSVSFRVPRPLTRGISVTVLGPWEGTTGYTALVAWRYAGHRVGDPVTFGDARTQTRGSACWGGTTAAAVTVPLTVRKVTVDGTTGPTDGTIAYADVTQPWLWPMRDAGKGVLGSQDVVTCRK